MARNACELEIDLFCHGMVVPGEVSQAGRRTGSRSGARLGSGLEIAIPVGSALKDEIRANVPVEEAFAKRSPYRLTGGSNGGYSIIDQRTGDAYRVRLPEAPSWYERETSRAVPMAQVGLMQGTYLAIQTSPACTFWHDAPSRACRFCAPGQPGDRPAGALSIDDVVETCWAARDESGVTFVQLSGRDQGDRGLECISPYIKAIKERVGLLVGVQLPPARDLARYDALVALGVDQFSFNVDFMDPRWFRGICPGKAVAHGQPRYFDAMAYCVSLLPRGSVSGEIIAGLEPVEKTLSAIDRIARLGAFPTVRIFRPTIGSAMADWAPPQYEEMRRVIAHVYDACHANWLPICVAPNVEASRAVSPDDGALLVDRGAGFYVYEAYRRLAHAVAGPGFRHRLRPTG